MVYNIAKNFDKLIRFIKYFLSTYFKEQVLGLLLILPGEPFLGGTEIAPPPPPPSLSSMDS